MIVPGPFADVVNPATGRRVREAWPRPDPRDPPAARLVWRDPAERPAAGEPPGYDGVAWYASQLEGLGGPVVVSRFLARPARGGVELAMPRGARFVVLRVQPRGPDAPPLLLVDSGAEDGRRLGVAEYLGVVAPLVARLDAGQRAAAEVRPNPARGRRRNPSDTAAADDPTGARLTLERYDPPRRADPTSGAFLTWVDPRPLGWIARDTATERPVVAGARLSLFADRAARPPRLRARLERGPFGPSWQSAADRGARVGAYDGPYDPIAVAVAGLAAPRALALELDAATLEPTADALRRLGVAGWSELTARTPFAAMLARLAELGAVRDLAAATAARRNPAASAARRSRARRRA